MKIILLDEDEVDVHSLIKENKDITSKCNAIQQGYEQLSSEIDEVYALMFDEERDDDPQEKLTKIKTLLADINKNPIKRRIFRSWCNK